MDSVLIVHGSAVGRAEIAGLLGRLGHDVNAVAAPLAALQVVRTSPPALVIIDVASGGLELCREISDLAPSVSIVMVSSNGDASTERIAGLLAGADDYLHEPYDRDELLARVRRILERRRRWMQLATPSRSPSALTPRELEVLDLLAEGMSTSEIASRLVISSKTVATHVQHILAKLGVHSQAQVVAFAYTHGLVGTRLPNAVA